MRKPRRKQKNCADSEVADEVNDKSKDMKVHCKIRRGKNGIDDKNFRIEVVAQISQKLNANNMDNHKLRNNF